MPPRKMSSRNAPPAAPPAEGIDRIGALPDEVIHHVLSFLEAQDAVRTCVLARRWRYLWRYATGIRIRSSHLREIREFIDNLLLLRGLTPLFKCEFLFDEYDDEDVPHLNHLIKHAILCKVQTLRIRNIGCEGSPFVSQNLTRLDLEDMVLEDNFLNFSSSCPALQNLSLTVCFIESPNISSDSLKYLSINECHFSFKYRTRICAPGLISLCLDDYWSKTPVLGGMPSLVDAIVRVTHDSADCCSYSLYGDCGFEDCNDCYGDIHDKNNCVLLEGLSEAKSLALVAETRTFIFTRDLKRCPTFSKLKTLLLNEYWFRGPGFNALICILKHTPVLEKLVLYLFLKGQKHGVEMKGRYISMQKSAEISEHLEIVEVKCKEVDRNVVKVLKFFGTFGIYFCF
ncbi:unnamed protein product [Urochloa decumbens]|uniref:F-box domain-containing protein n=1 Tax=Urochloa decumbens TaxID=240449 RepID=A0ABC9B0S3_9POAL